MPVLALTVAAAAAWLPIAWRFWRLFRRRGNPISLAICATVLWVIYCLLSIFWAVAGVDARALAVVRALLSAGVAAFFYGAFRWSDRHFRGDRPDDA